jgi:hypothetical protein
VLLKEENDSAPQSVERHKQGGLDQGPRALSRLAFRVIATEEERNAIDVCALITISLIGCAPHQVAPPPPPRATHTRARRLAICGTCAR